MPPGPLVAMATPGILHLGIGFSGKSAGLFMHDCDIVRGRGARKRTIKSLLAAPYTTRTSLVDAPFRQCIDDVIRNLIMRKFFPASMLFATLPD